MPPALPYYPFYVQDFDEDEKVIGMTLAEVGLYLLTLNESWKRGYIPNDLQALALRIRRPLPEVRRAWPAVSKCWVTGSSGLVNPRQEIEREKAKARSDRARENVKRRYTGEPTAVDTIVDTGDDVRAYVSLSLFDSKVSKSEEEYEGQKEDFMEFWSEYWRKVARSGKYGAEATYMKKVKSHELHVEVMQAIRLQKPVMMCRPPEAQPHAATWINGKRWEDDPSTFDPAAQRRNGSGNSAAELAAL